MILLNVKKLLHKLIKSFSILMIIGIICNPLYAKSDAMYSREYHLKGALLKYIIDSIAWPENTLPPNFVNICLLGEFSYPVGINAVNGMPAQDRVIVVRNVPTLEAAKDNCQMLYIAQSEEKNIPQILKTFEAKPVLLLGDMEDFAKKGGSINFAIINNLVALTLNQETLNRAHFKIKPEAIDLVTVIPEKQDLE